KNPKTVETQIFRALCGRHQPLRSSRRAYLWKSKSGTHHNLLNNSRRLWRTKILSPNIADVCSIIALTLELSVLILTRRLLTLAFRVSRRVRRTPLPFARFALSGHFRCLQYRG